MVEKSAEQQALEKGTVECLGMRFDNEGERRAYFADRLRDKLADPEFRKTPGFPKGTDEDIVRMSDPPWYTACPNPFLADFVSAYGKPYDPSVPYDRDPFAVDTSVGKTDALYKAHGYHTKVPHLAIVPSILHYTEPGDVVLDGFCGSGMTGIAAQWCEFAPPEYRLQLESEWQQEGRKKPTWGARRAILNDLSPAATFISANYNQPFSLLEFEKSAKSILLKIESDFGWMYDTAHSDGKKSGKINFMVWSEVFSCPECASDIIFTDVALDDETAEVSKVFYCSSCNAELTKRALDRKFESYLDPLTGETLRRLQFKPVLINYRVGRNEYEKAPDSLDLDALARINSVGLSSSLHPQKFPIDKMYHGSRLQPKGFDWVHQLYTHRALIILGAVLERISLITDPVLRRGLNALVYHQTVNASLRNSYRPGSTFGNRAITGVYYVSSMPAEANVFSLIAGSLKRIIRLKTTPWQKFKHGGSIINTGNASSLYMVADSSIDYVFTDPPFGSNIFYADLNICYESWLGVSSSPKSEAIVDAFKGKELTDYQSLMRACFSEYARVLKPGRWMTIVFSNSSNAVWRAIQEALGTAGFIVADVRTLDKQQGSYRQVTSTAMKQDLVISAYKPTLALSDRFALGASSAEGAWAFVAEHLSHVPVFSAVGGIVDVLAERTAQVLHDRMVAFHVQRQLSVPLSTSEFLGGLNQRYPERDGMYFLAVQVADYDRKRNTTIELRQLSLFVIDEASAIQWVRRELQDKPRSFQDLQPAFMREIQNWAKHEQTVELKEILRQNCIHFDGAGPVPSQIHSYLSTNFKELRNLTKNDPSLVAKAADRWYVPDPNKQIDLEKLREKSLLTEFETYKASKERKLKLFRSEAVRAGFKSAYDGQDYKTIVSVAAKLPENVLQEDEKLLMYYDVASMRLGDE